MTDVLDAPSLFASRLSSTRQAARHAQRAAVLGLGGVLVVVGAVLSLLPGHLGVPLVVVGLVLVLRNSPRARRQFVRLQRRHPRYVFPLRRLLRRQPEVAPVVWQQVLRLERALAPRSWRRAVRLRRRYFRTRAV